MGTSRSMLTPALPQGREQTGEKTPKFTLCSGVFLVTGVSRGAICDTRTGNVYSINGTAMKILLREIGNESYWKKLAAMNLVMVTEENLPDDYLKIPKTESFQLKFIWFEIVSGDCNERCLQCYADSMPPTYRKMMGLGAVPVSKTEVSLGQKLTFQEWCKLIKKGYQLGCRKGQFIGGEPFLYRGENNESVLDLAQYARQVGYEKIEIFTNATLLTPKKVERIKELNLQIAVSLYSSEEVIHDKVTRTPGSYQLTMRGLRLLKEAGVSVRVEVVVMQVNQNTVAQTVQLIEDMGFRHKHPDPLRPIGRGDDLDLLPDLRIVVNYGLQVRPNFQANLQKLTRYASGHSCLAGKIVITDCGDILPCVFSRSQVVGNIKNGGLLESVVQSEQLQRIWHTTKDEVLVCQDCEYRYVCFDCRPLSEGAAQGRSNFYQAPYPRCTYNPYTGQWAQGIWRLDKDGKLYYDTTIGSVIRSVLG